MSAPPVPARGPLGNERGIALVMTLMVLLATSLLSVALLMTLQVEKKMTGEAMRYSQSLNLAEAGLAEAMSRIRNGDVPSTPPLNPRMCTQIFNVPAGSVPTYANTDSIAIHTGQVAGNWLTYTTSVKSADALTVTYKTDPTRTVVYRYDPTLNPPVNPNSGFPIYVIRATGRKGGTLRRVQAEVIQKPLNLSIKGAMAVGAGIDFGGNAQVCGYNHRGDTPNQTLGTHANPVGAPCEAYETGVGDLYGAWSGSTITSSGSSTQGGWPISNAQNMPSFYAGPWEALGLTQAEFFAWIGAPRSTMPVSLKGIYYLDNNGITQDQSGAWSVGAISGEGLLYVDGDLTLNSNFVFRGMIYVEGDVKVNGNSWVLGSVIVRGKGRITNGSMVILYSNEAVSSTLAKYGGQFTTLSWREVN
jgi:Tfp pilus assembly protein PilX